MWVNDVFSMGDLQIYLFSQIVVRICIFCQRYSVNVDFLGVGPGAF